MNQIERARFLRRNMTDAERRLWRNLRRRLLGVHFRRQVPMGCYIVDFACLSRHIVIEVDGGQHLQSETDALRDRWLRSQGFQVLRFWNHEVLKNMEGVLQAIALAIGVELSPEGEEKGEADSQGY